jgi:hypothetical protein
MKNTAVTIDMVTRFNQLIKISDKRKSIKSY